jgi:hypothetical protein
MIKDINSLRNKNVYSLSLQQSDKVELYRGSQLLFNNAAQYDYFVDSKI